MWFPDLNQGRGYPFLAFYAPLVFFAAGALHSLGASLALCLKLVVVLGMAAGASGAYRLLRLGFAPCGAIAGAALCSYAPYHVRDLTIRGDLAEFVAASFLPWSLFAVLRLARKHRPGDVVLAAALGALPVLTHNIVALFGGGMMVLAAAAAAAVSPRKIATATAAACAGAGTLALSAFFWLPALYERRHVRIDAMTEGIYDVERNFLALRDFFATPAVPGIGQQLPMSFELGWPALAGLAFLPFALRGATGMRAALLALGAAASLGGLVMTMPAGAPIYDAVPLLRFVQFPWRFLVLVSLGLGVLGGAGLGAFLAGRIAWVRSVVAGAAAIFAVTAVSPLLGPKPHGEIPPWSVDPEELARGRQTATGVGEYQPRWAGEAPPAREFDRGIRAPEGVRIEGEGRSVGRYEFVVESAGPSTILLRDVYYPGWTAEVGGREVSIRPHAENGQLELDVGPGRHEVRVRLEATPLRRVARLVSAAAAVAALVTLAFVRRRS
ncbi:MAG: 6-pyruvoyl-tetrahydropterin synthase-related protein [Candidatus Eiseniibacteriota bacterium]